MRALRNWILLFLLAVMLVACGGTPSPLPLAEQATLTPVATQAPPEGAAPPATPHVPPTRNSTALPPADSTPLAPTSTATALPPADPIPSPFNPPDQVQITIVYDNTAVEPGLEAEWGFAAWIDYGDEDVLFDTGPGGPALLGNLATLGLSPEEIDLVVLSHEHGDHTGGLLSLLQTGVKPVIYVPSSFPSGYKRLLSSRTDLVEVTDPIEILPGLHSTGELHASIQGQEGALTEQALVIETSEGSVVITGCAHPGIVPIVRAAQRVVPGDIALVMGGFHLMDKTTSAIHAAVESLRELGVQQVSPTHCTGEHAIAIFAAAYGENYIEGGAGRVYLVGTPPAADLPGGLSPAQLATLSSLEQVGEYPLYVMHYYGDYNPSVSSEAPASARTPAWACSLFAALGDEENRLYGRNFDWRFSPALLLFTDPSDGYASVSMVDIAYFGFDDEDVRALVDQPTGDLLPLLETPHWPFDGMNEQGLAVGMAAVPTGGMVRDPEKPTIGSLGIIRAILDNARDVNEALALLQAHNIDMEGGPDLHYLVADRSGRALLVEFYRGNMMVTPSEQPWHLATNFISAAIHDPSEAGCWRYDRLGTILSQVGGCLDGAGAMDLLAQVSQSNTQWSVVYGLGTGDVQVSMGRQYESPYAFHLPADGGEGAP